MASLICSYLLTYLDLLTARFLLVMPSTVVGPSSAVNRSPYDIQCIGSDGHAFFSCQVQDQTRSLTVS